MPLNHWTEGTTLSGETAHPLVISGSASHGLDEVPETIRYEVAASIGSGWGTIAANGGVAQCSCCLNVAHHWNRARPRR